LQRETSNARVPSAAHIYCQNGARKRTVFARKQLLLQKKQHIGKTASQKKQHIGKTALQKKPHIGKTALQKKQNPFCEVI